LKFQLHSFVFSAVKSKLHKEPPDSTHEEVGEEVVVPTRKSKTTTTLPVLTERRKMSQSSSRQNLYPSYKRLNSALPPIDEPSSPNLKNTSADEVGESFTLKARLLNPESEKKPSPKKTPKRIEMKKSQSNSALLPTPVIQSPMVSSSSEKHIAPSRASQGTEKVSSEPQKKKTLSDGKKSSPVIRETHRSSTSRLSLAKIDVATTQIDQWTVISSTINSALHVVVDR
jgi:hypothetical protein